MDYTWQAGISEYRFFASQIRYSRFLLSTKRYNICFTQAYCFETCLLITLSIDRLLDLSVNHLIAYQLSYPRHRGCEVENKLTPIKLQGEDIFYELNQMKSSSASLPKHKRLSKYLYAGCLSN
jgi:hypothetical protein